MRILGGLSLLFVTATILCCSSSEDSAPTTPNDAGGDPDSSPAIDAGSDTTTTTTSSGDFVSGSRLRAEVLESTGAQLFVRFHDTKLDVSCTFAAAEDGKIRCLPANDAIDDTQYADNTCGGQRVYVARAGCDVPKMAALGYSKTCTAGAPIYKIGAASGAANVWVKSDSGCDMVTPPGTVYLVADHVAASELVAATLSQQPIADGLGVTKLSAEDGAQQVLEPYDLTRKSACRRSGSTGGKPADRCVPSRIAYEEDVFSDIGCTMVAAYGPATQGIECTTSPTAILRQGLPSACGVYEPKYNELGAKVTTTLYRNPAMCAATTNISDGTYWSLGADLALASLPAITDKDEGTGSIKLRSIATSSGAHVIGRTFYDSDRKVECQQARAGDGAFRCLPPAITGTQVVYYADTDCKKPLIDVDAGCAPPSYAHLMSPDATTCKGPTTRYFSIGAKVTPAKVYANFGAAPCLEQAMPAGDLYDASTEIAPTTFALVTPKTL